MPEITVIITAYKDRGWIEEAIRSAEKQTFKDYDIIFASDGNPWIENYATDHGIPFHYFQKSNYSTLVNRAVREAKGNWIKILHDDDLLTDTCLEDLYNARGSADLVYGNAIIFNGDDKKNFEIYRPPDKVTLRNLLPITICPVNFEAELIRKEAFLDSGGFDERLGYSEDYDLLINFLVKGYSVQYCDKEVVWYRHHPRQISGNEPEMKKREQDYLQGKYIEQIVNLIKWDDK